MISRRRQTPWIQRWSRQLIGAIALLGAINTAYLTFTKLRGIETACPTSGCEQVLSGPYATVLNQPLSLFGLLAYITIAVLALAPLALKSDGTGKTRSPVDQWAWLALFAGTTAMTIFSGYLMYIMVTKYIVLYGAKAVCVYCIVSALFATTLFVLTLIGRTWEDLGQLGFIGLAVGMVTIIGTLGVYAHIDRPVDADAGDSGTQQYSITSTSGPAELALAQHLKEIDAKMYSAFWCPHCHDQKQLFGKEAFKLIQYIECAPEGKNPQVELCQKSGLKGYPTWEINGKLLEGGAKPLKELATVSGYSGPSEFKNKM